MEETDDIFDEIWTFVEEKLKTPVPPYFKYILKSCGYNNGLSIATIDDDDIEHFVNEVKNGNVRKYFEALAGETDVLEGSTKNTDDFEFSRGHLKFLKAIVVFVKKYAEDNGPDSFTVENKKKTTKSKKADVTNGRQKKMKYSNSDMLSAHEISSEMEKDIEKHRQILCKKLVTSLKSHTPKLYTINRMKIEKMMQNNQLVSVEIKQSEQQHSENSTRGSTEAELLFKFVGSSFCPYCSKKVNVFWVSNTQWNSSNFDRHLNLTHPKTSSDLEKDCKETTTEPTKNTKTDGFDKHCNEIPVAPVKIVTNDEQRNTIEAVDMAGATQTDVLYGVIEIGANEMDKPTVLMKMSNKLRKSSEASPNTTGSIEVVAIKTNLIATNDDRCLTTEVVETTIAIEANAKTSGAIADGAFKTNLSEANDATKIIAIGEPIDEIKTGNELTVGTEKDVSVQGYDTDEIEVISLSDDDMEASSHLKNIVGYSDTDSDSSLPKQEESKLPKKGSEKRSELKPITMSSRLPIRRQFTKSVKKIDLKAREEKWNKYF